eukprot:3482415-Karenia_brevis.AAC.1
MVSPTVLCVTFISGAHPCRSCFGMHLAACDHTQICPPAPRCMVLMICCKTVSRRKNLNPILMVYPAGRVAQDPCHARMSPIRYSALLYPAQCNLLSEPMLVTYNRALLLDDTLLIIFLS